MLLNRINKGICYTDEMWYVAEPFVVSQGAIPYVNNWTQAPGFSIPLALLYKLFLTIRGGTEGIVLFSRVAYVGWLICVIGSTIAFINKGSKTKISWLVVFPLLFLTPFQLYAINYNTIGLVYLLPVSALLLKNLYDEESKGFFARGIIAGLLMARAIIGTPNSLIAAALLFAVLVLKKRWKTLKGYIIGGIIMTIIVLGYCCIAGGSVARFANGLLLMLDNLGYFKITGVSFEDKLKALGYVLKPFLYCAIGASALKIFFAKNIKVYKAALTVLVLAFLLIGLIKGREGYPYGFERLNSWCWFESVILAMYYPRINNDKERIMSLVAVTYFVVYLFVGFTNISGFTPRSFWLYVAVICSFTYFYVICKDCFSHKIFAETVFVASVVMLGVIMVFTSYGYVFDDAAVGELKYKVDSGIWKGIYTTEEKKNTVIKMEKAINKMTKEENILFLDWASFGYLISKGHICAPSSYDSCGYSYKVNEPDIMYDYFYHEQTVPDAIIYVDYGHDEVLSIEYPGWKFNEFVKENYILRDSYSDEELEVLRYEIVSQKDALKWVNEKQKEKALDI